jgi:hypothetical protein
VVAVSVGFKVGVSGIIVGVMTGVQSTMIANGRMSENLNLTILSTSRLFVLEFS